MRVVPSGSISPTPSLPFLLPSQLIALLAGIPGCTPSFESEGGKGEKRSEVLLSFPWCASCQQMSAVEEERPAHGATPALLTELSSLFLNEEWSHPAAAAPQVCCQVLLAERLCSQGTAQPGAPPAEMLTSSSTVIQLIC